MIWMKCADVEIRYSEWNEYPWYGLRTPISDETDRNHLAIWIDGMRWELGQWKWEVKENKNDVISVNFEKLQTLADYTRFCCVHSTTCPHVVTSCVWWIFACELLSTKWGVNRERGNHSLWIILFHYFYEFMTCSCVIRRNVWNNTRSFEQTVHTCVLFDNTES